MKTKTLVSLLLSFGWILAACTQSDTPKRIPPPPTKTPETVKLPPGDESKEPGPEYHLHSSQVRLVGGYGNNWDHNATQVQVAQGSLDLHIDADANQGAIVTSFTVAQFNPASDIYMEDTEVTLVFPVFGFPPDIKTPEYMQGGIAEEVQIPDELDANPWSFPVTGSALASWGPVLVYANGEQIEGDETFFGEPNPQGAFIGQMIYTPGLIQTDETQEDPTLRLVVRSENVDPENSPHYDFFMNVTYPVVAAAHDYPISRNDYEAMADRTPEQVIELSLSPWMWVWEEICYPYMDCDGDGFETTLYYCLYVDEDDEDWERYRYGLGCPEGYRVVGRGGDCDDYDSDRYPGNPEVGDAEGHDEDCNSSTVCSWNGDCDWDQDNSISKLHCNWRPNWELYCGDDCDDYNPGRYPQQVEACNHIDDNCNELVDEGITTWAYWDGDGDLFGDPNTRTEMCPYEVTEGWVNNNTDCDDHQATVNPSNGNCP